MNVAETYVSRILKGEKTSTLVEELEDKYSSEDVLQIFIMIKQISAELLMQQGKAKVPDCQKCKFKTNGLSGSHHIGCTCVYAVVRGSEHGIKNGWFQYPFDFDQIWLTYCDSFQSLS